MSTASKGSLCLICLTWIIFIVAVVLKISGSGAFAQENPDSIKQEISGRILDEDTGEPIPAVNIFFANYQEGTFSDETGFFSLPAPGQPPLVLVFSHISYETQYVTLDTLISQFEINVSMRKRTMQLDEVHVASDIDKEWNRNLKRFSRAFLGDTDNAQKCTITNPHILNFKYEKEQLKAASDDLIVVENRATGYKVYFLLEYFSMHGEQVSFAGKPFFEPLVPVSDRENNRWLRNRKDTYYGSQRHFLKTLLQGSTFEEGYEIVGGRIHPAEGFEFRNLVSPEEIVIRDDGKTFLNLFTSLKITYTREKEFRPPSSSMDKISVNNPYQTSYLSSRIARIRISEEGVLYRPELIEVYGFWAMEGVADFLPFDFNPMVD